MPRHRRLLACALALGCGLTVAGCTSQDRTKPVSDSRLTATAGRDEGGRPGPEDPPPGHACYRVTAEETGQSHSSAEPVSCAEPHTTETIAVLYLSAAALGSADQPDTQGIAAYATDHCNQAYVRHVGGTIEERILSRATSVWFVPSDRDIGLGASWLRCDVAVFETDGQLASLTGGTEGMLDAPGALDEYGLCSTGPPGETDSEHVTCGSPHSWRAFTVIRLGTADDDWPGTEVRDDEECSQAARTHLGFPTEWEYGWQPPSQRQWAEGRRWGLCWAPD